MKILLEQLKELLEEWIAELAGYGVGFYAWIRHSISSNCDDWTSKIGLVIVLITLFGITIPKVIKENRRKK